MIKNNHVLNEGYSNASNKIYITNSHKCYLEDFDKNTYIDTGMGAGTFLLGYSNNKLKKHIQNQLQKGTLFIQPHFSTHKLAKKLSSILPHFEKFVFCSTGSEATMRALRIAKTFTKKRKIAVFSGGWHGGNDLLLVDDTYEKLKTQKTIKSNGIPKEILNDVILLPYNDSSAFKLIEKHKDELAMVFIEPSQGSNPRNDLKDFLFKLRSITKKYNILLGFDEIITGFRITLGGAQEYYGIEADISTYGKALGGGYPIGVVAGKKEIMNSIEKGNIKNSKPIFMGGTFSANPLSITASLTIIDYLINNNDNFYKKLNSLSSFLQKEINTFCEENNLKVHMIGINSMLRLIFTNYPIKSRYERDKYEISYEIQNLFYLDLLNNGLHISGNRLIFISKEHRKKDIIEIIKIIKKSLLKFKKEGYL